MSESERRMIEILRILNKQNKPTGSKLLADELRETGFNLGERAVRYHMQILDEKGYTERMGYSGRRITELGREKLEKGLIYDQVDFIYSKFEELIYLTDFNYMDKKGNVIKTTLPAHYTIKQFYSKINKGDYIRVTLTDIKVSKNGNPVNIYSIEVDPDRFKEYCQNC